MAVKITMGNAKGGIGKTTISSMLSYYLSLQGYKTLLIDLDPQANATDIINNTFFPGQEKNYTTLVEGLREGDISKSVFSINENYSFVPSSQNTTDFYSLLNSSNKYTLLKEEINKVEKHYDFIFYDVPPTIFTDFINNALVASDFFIILTETSEFSFSGISDMYDTGKKMSEVNNKLDFLGILINMREDDKKVIADLDKKYDIKNEEMFFKSYVPKRKRVVKYADVEGMFSRNKESFVKKDRWDIELENVFENLSKELLEKINKR